MTRQPCYVVVQQNTAEPEALMDATFHLTIK